MEPSMSAPMNAPRREHTPHAPADLGVAEFMERHAHELLSEAAAIRARAAGEAPADEELLDVGTIAMTLQVSKGAATNPRR